MTRRELKLGDRVEVEKNGVKFPAKVTSFPLGQIGITPEQPQRFSWRVVGPRAVRRKLEPVRG